MNKAQNRTDRKTMHKMVCMFAFFLLIAAWVVGRLASYQIKKSRLLPVKGFKSAYDTNRGNAGKRYDNRPKRKHPRDKHHGLQRYPLPV